METVQRFPLMALLAHWGSAIEYHTIGRPCACSTSPHGQFDRRIISTSFSRVAEQRSYVNRRPPSRPVHRRTDASVATPDTDVPNDTVRVVLPSVAELAAGASARRTAGVGWTTGRGRIAPTICIPWATTRSSGLLCNPAARPSCGRTVALGRLSGRESSVACGKRRGCDCERTSGKSLRGPRVGAGVSAATVIRRRTSTPCAGAGTAAPAAAPAAASRWRPGGAMADRRGRVSAGARAAPHQVETAPVGELPTCGRVSRCSSDIQAAMRVWVKMKQPNMMTGLRHGY